MSNMGNGTIDVNTLQLNGSGLNNSDPYTEDYYYYYDYVPYKKNIVDIEIPIIGYVFPVLAIPTVIFNSLVVIAFSKKAMRTPTSILLIAMAITDSIVCLTILPVSFYFFVGGRYTSYLRYEWCLTEYILYVIQRMFRTASNWITVALGTQRYIIVCYPFKAKTICTLKSSFLASVASVIAAICIHVNLALAIDIQPLQVVLSNVTSSGCIRSISQWYTGIVGDVSKSLMMYYLFSGLLSRFLPCLVLSVTTGLLVYKLKTRKREIGQCVNKTSSAESFRRITKLVMVVMVIFLLTETQDFFAFSIYAYECATDSLGQVLSEEQDATWSAIGMLLSLIGYIFNFWIYILMSRQFRIALLGFFTSNLICNPQREDKTQTTILNSSPSTRAKIYCNSDSSGKLLENK